MKKEKIVQRISAFILGIIITFSITSKKALTKSIIINYVEKTNNNIGTINYKQNEIDKKIDYLLNYYKDTSISKDSILLLNYSFLNDIGYVLNNNVDSNSLNAIEKIKFSNNGWCTLKKKYILNNNNADSSINEDWREIEKLELIFFTREILQKEPIKYSPLLLDKEERKDAEELEKTCYNIYKEYYKNNSIMLNLHLIKLKNIVENENFFYSRSNGFYKVTEEILREFQQVFTMIDVKYDELRSTVCSRFMECQNKYNYLTAHIVNKLHLNDNNFGIYAYHPYRYEYANMEHLIDIKNLQGRVYLPHDYNIMEDKINIKTYYINKINTINKLQGKNENIVLFSNNSYELLNRNYLEENGLPIPENSSLKAVYDDIATIYIFNKNILNSTYNINSSNYLNTSYCYNPENLLMKYSELILSKPNFIMANEIENLYYDILNNEINYHNIDYSLEKNDFIEEKLKIINKKLNQIQNNDDITLKIVLYTMVKQWNKYIAENILSNDNTEVNIQKQLNNINNTIKKYCHNQKEINDDIEKNNQFKEDEILYIDINNKKTRKREIIF